MKRLDQKTGLTEAPAQKASTELSAPSKLGSRIAALAVLALAAGCGEDSKSEDSASDTVKCLGKEGKAIDTNIEKTADLVARWDSRCDKLESGDPTKNDVCAVANGNAQKAHQDGQKNLEKLLKAEREGVKNNKIDKYDVCRSARTDLQRKLSRIRQPK
ncbi:hypothetical protein JW911_02705 [Candidatus Peregrinibacteria bacterium]|nr:hypothetical protein [Candidatus Peregrinibacteria bacterium]